MCRAPLATLAILAVVTVSFGAGWVASDSEEHPAADRPAHVVALKPLPVPRVIIQHGPWADPLPEMPNRAPVRPARADGMLGELSRLSLDLPGSFYPADCTDCQVIPLQP